MYIKSLLFASEALFELTWYFGRGRKVSKISLMTLFFVSCKISIPGVNFWSKPFIERDRTGILDHPAKMSDRIHCRDNKDAFKYGPPFKISHKREQQFCPRFLPNSLALQVFLTTHSYLLIAKRSHQFPNWKLPMLLSAAYTQSLANANEKTSSTNPV